MLGILDLPPELRLDIYERVLTFASPLKRITRIDDSGHAYTYDPGDEDEYEPPMVVDIIPLQADVAILSTGRAVYHEALPVLYKMNTMIFGYDNTCFLEHDQAFTDLDRRLLQQAVILDGANHCKACSGGIPKYLKCFHEENFPRLKKITLLLDRDGAREFSFKIQERQWVTKVEILAFVHAFLDYNALCKVLTKEAGVDATTEVAPVGCLTLRNSRLSISLCYISVATTWQYWRWLLANLRPDKLMSMWRRHAGIGTEWLEPGAKMNSETCEELTRSMLRIR